MTKRTQLEKLRTILALWLVGGMVLYVILMILVAVAGFAKLCAFLIGAVATAALAWLMLTYAMASPELMSDLMITSEKVQGDIPWSK